MKARKGVVLLEKKEDRLVGISKRKGEGLGVGMLWNGGFSPGCPGRTFKLSLTALSSLELEREKEENRGVLFGSWFARKGRKSGFWVDSRGKRRVLSLAGNHSGVLSSGDASVLWFLLLSSSRLRFCSSLFLFCRSARLWQLIAEEAVAGARTRFGARRSGPSRWRASASLAMAEDSRRSQQLQAAGTVRREGRRKTRTVAVGRAWDFEKKEGKKENGLMGPVRKKRK